MIKKPYGKVLDNWRLGHKFPPINSDRELYIKINLELENLQKELFDSIKKELNGESTVTQRDVEHPIS